MHTVRNFYSWRRRKPGMLQTLVTKAEGLFTKKRKREEEIDDFGVFQALGLWGGIPQNEKGRFFRLCNVIG